MSRECGKRRRAHQEVPAGEADGLVIPSDDSAVNTVRKLVHVLREDAGLWEDEHGQL